MKPLKMNRILAWDNWLVDMLLNKKFKKKKPLEYFRIEILIEKLEFLRFVSYFRR